MRKTNFTFRNRRELKVKANSKLQFSLWFLLFVLFMGMSSLVHAQCNITVAGTVNIAIGNNGTDTITVEDVLLNAPGCSGLVATVYDAEGNIIPDGIIDCSYVGDTLSVCVHEEGVPPGNCTDCCAQAIICDFTAPVVQCVNDTISCLESGEPPFPIATDNCTPSADITFNVLSETPFDIPCDSTLIKGIVREIVAVDAQGNVSEVCHDTLFVERFNMDELTMPDSLTRADSTALLCDESNWTDTNNNNYPDVGEPGVGVPTYRGVPMFPVPPSLCCVVIDVEDFEVPCGTCGCTQTRIIRKFTATEWWCNTEVTQTYVQIIEVIDTTGPEVQAPADFTVSANNNDCTASVTIPAAQVTEDCGTISQYYVEYPGGFESLTTPQPVDLELNAGDNEIVIKAYNNCLLEGTDTLVVTVLDGAAPIAVCDHYTVTTLGVDGTSRVYATTFDDGSYDNCKLDSMDVRRVDGQCGTGAPDDWGSYVEFCCSDLGTPVTVQFRVFDASGNYNICTVEVEVQDVIEPYLTCPDDIEISCTYAYDMNDLSEFGTVRVLTDPNDMSPVQDIVIDPDPDDSEGAIKVGEDGYAYDNCNVTIVEDATLITESCGTGVIERVFSAVNSMGQTIATCTQYINIVNFHPFNPETDVIWPEDITLTNLACDVDSLTPEYLNSIGEDGTPELIEGPCDMVADTYEDLVFRDVESGCFKILRTWSVFDFCIDCDQCQAYEYCQTIKVVNNIAPTFDGNCADITLSSSNPDCDSRYISLTQSATDDCTPADMLSYSYRIDTGNDGTYDISGQGNDASGDYGYGTHKIEWVVSDHCGNVSTCSYTFTVTNEKAGTPIAYNGLAVELNPKDSDGDGVIDGASVTINVEILDAGSFHSCGLPFTLSFSADPTDTTRTYTCDDVGQVPVELWIHASNGTHAHVRTYILIQANDPSEPCGPGNTGPSTLVAGTITTTSDYQLPAVSVELQGEANKVAKTDSEGDYEFNNVAQNGNYVVSPTFNNNVLNGVTTWDLTLIQQYILGMNDIVDPYLILAADINNDRRITVLDLVALRKTILGLNTTFPNNESWRFIEKGYEFDGVGSDILNEDIPSSYSITNLESELNNLNFYGVKVGDMNNTVDIPGLQGADTRGEAVAAAIQNVDFEAGDIVEVPVKANNLQNVLALQYSMKYNAAVLDFLSIKSGVLEVGNENYASVKRGLITMSWNDVNAHNVDENETLFTLVFHSNQAGMLSEALDFNNEVTESLVVDNNVEKDFTVEFRGVSTDQYALYQNVPNPVNGTTVIGLTLAEDLHGTMSFYDITGKLLMSVEKQFHQGYNEITIEKNQLGISGVVFYKFSSEEFSATKKMVIIE